jgi:hypothetical protein
MKVQKQRLKKLSLWLVAAGAAVLFTASPAKATTPQPLDIKVSISNVKDLTVDTTYYDFRALSVNVGSVTATAITVTNASGGLVSTYTIQGADANSTQAGTTWILDTSTGTVDHYKLAAQFGTARPVNNDPAWASDDLTTGAIAADGTTLGNGTYAESGGGVSPLAGQNQRSLWFRIVTPLMTSDNTQRKAVVTLAVQ